MDFARPSLDVVEVFLLYTLSWAQGLRLMARGSHVRWSDSMVHPWSASDSYGSFAMGTVRGDWMGYGPADGRWFGS